MIIGYCRVSTADQTLDLQVDALTKAGCEKIFEDKASGSKDDRLGLLAALEFVRSGDSLAVWRLDRLSRSLSHLVTTVNELSDRGVGFISLTEAINSHSASGRLVLHIFASLAEFERALVRERTMAGLLAARARGRVGGRPPVLDSRQTEVLKTLLKDPAMSIHDITQTLGVSRATVYRYGCDVRRAEVRGGRVPVYALSEHQPEHAVSPSEGNTDEGGHNRPGLLV